MLFFQATLLAGYAYAHVLSRRLGLKGQIGVHMGVLLVGALFLPVVLAPSWQTAPLATAPLLYLFAILVTVVGVPFLAISASAPLLQRWFTATGHPHAADPYFLYGASNAGSIGGLLAYPFLVEPLFGLAGQGRIWAVGYALLTFLTLLVGGLTLGRSRRPAANPTIGRSGPASSVRPRQRLLWLLYAAGPAALLHAVTNHITTDIAAAPLLWVLPLALYLLTFVIAFARRQWFSPATSTLVGRWAALVLFLTFAIHPPGTGILLAHVVLFFVIALACHVQLVARRPPAEHLTAFYLFMSLGGMLGGAFVTVVAPVTFKGVLEYPIAIGVCAALTQGLDRRPGWRDLLVPLAAVAAFLLARQALAPADASWGARVVFYAPLLLAPLIALSQHQRPVGFGGVLALGLIALLAARGDGALVLQERSFFGVYRLQDKEDGLRLLEHGTTVHGAQHRDPVRAREMLAYYSAEGPLGDVIAALEREQGIERVGLTGLGAGAAVCHARPDQQWRLFEIDPLVVRIASDPGLFTYLDRCLPQGSAIVLGDARLSLAAEQAPPYDLLILDAFSSDSVPTHLLTVEAMRLYLDRVGDGGLIAVNLSNRYLDLVPVLAGIVAANGAAGRYRVDVVDEARNPGRSSSLWAVVASDPEVLASLDLPASWHPLPPPPPRPWSDDYVNLLATLQLESLLNPY